MLKYVILGSKMTEKQIKDLLGKYELEFEKDDLFMICEALLGSQLEAFAARHCTEEDALTIAWDEMDDEALFKDNPKDTGYHLYHTYPEAAKKLRDELNYWMP